MVSGYFGYVPIILFVLFITAYTRLFHSTLTDWGLAISIFAGFLSVALAIGFGLGKRVNDFLNETKRGTVDEKIAMLYGYTNDLKTWDNPDINVKYKVQRINSDLRSVGRLKKAIQPGQKEDLTRAKDALLEEMRKNPKLKTDSDEIERVFTSWVSS